MWVRPVRMKLCGSQPTCALLPAWTFLSWDSQKLSSAHVKILRCPSGSGLSLGVCGHREFGRHDGVSPLQGEKPGDEKEHISGRQSWSPQLAKCFTSTRTLTVPRALSVGCGAEAPVWGPRAQPASSPAGCTARDVTLILLCLLPAFHQNVSPF